MLVVIKIFMAACKLIQMNHTNRATAQELVLIYLNLQSVQMHFEETSSGTKRPAWSQSVKVWWKK